MLSIKDIREKKEEIIKRLKIRDFNAEELIDSIINIDDEKRNIQLRKDQAQAKINSLSKEIGQLFSKGLKEEGNKVREETGELKKQIKELEHNFSNLEKSISDKLLDIPNIPNEKVIFGKGENDNEVVKEVISDDTHKGEGLPHWELIKKYNIIDFELGNKISGAGFPVYIGRGAKLQRALINFFLDEAEKAGYNEVLPPVLVNSDSAYATGQLPDKDGQMYKAELDDLYLIPTAEVPVTNIYRNTVIDEKQLPIKNVAFSSCFRREAGSWGADVRGLNRLHQFEKVEIVHVQTPEKSYESLSEMVDYVETLINKLKLPYRILRLCGGDLSFTASLTYDFEVLSKGQNKWLEVSSVSNFESFQANRLKLRYKCSETKKNFIAHTLNGSALALPRIMAAIIENYQTPEGIKVPEVLRKYTNFDIIN